MEDFSGVGMGRHREELIVRLDRILEQLDRGLEYLGQHKPGVDEEYVQMAKEQYEGLRKVLLEVDGEAANTFARMSLKLFLFDLLTPWICAESHSTFMCALPSHVRNFTV